MHKSKRVYFFLCLIFLVVPGILAQQSARIEIINTNSLEFNKQANADAKKLIGDVEFKHENAVMFCDSAFFYTSQNKIDAFGHIAIHQGDTLHLYGDKLIYDGNQRLAQIRGKVKLVDSESVLTTENLDFNIAQNVGYYFNGGNIVNKDNKLKSLEGYYYTKLKMLHFKKNVEIVNPKYVIKSDTLKYNTVKRTSYFLGPSTITSDENSIYCENGWYNTITNKSQFSKNAKLISTKRLLKGDSLYYERNIGLGKAYGNIFLIDSVRNIILTGNYALYKENPEYAFITDSATLIYAGKADSLFLHADTLEAYTDTSKINKIIKAYHEVRIFKPDMQGVCDSMSFTTLDSVMKMFYEPVLWSGANQISADEIDMYLANSQISTIDFTANCFIVSKEDTDKFSQVKGKNMKGYFKDNQLVKLSIKGNGQTLYYGRDKDKIVGVNRADCSNIDLVFEDRKMKKILFLVQPDATLFPVEKLPTDQKLLKGYKWLESQQPKNKEDIYRQTKVK